jgi:hypothetical protein
MSKGQEIKHIQLPDPSSPAEGSVSQTGGYTSSDFDISHMLMQKKKRFM